jgi:hypothetical protein
VSLHNGQKDTLFGASRYPDKRAIRPVQLLSRQSL